MRNDAGEISYSALVAEARASVPVSGAVPMFEMVNVLDPVLPTMTLPKSSEAGLTAIFGAGNWPVPATSSATTGVVGSLLENARQPAFVPARVGAYVTVNVVLPPASMVNGEGGDQLNSALVAGTEQGAICVTCSGAVPVFRTSAFREEDPPTMTLPKSSAAGARAMLGAGPTTPVPDRDTLTLALVASFLDTRIDPLSELVSAGV